MTILLNRKVPTSRRLLTRPFVIVVVSTFAFFVAVGALIPTLPRYVQGPLGGGAATVGLAFGAFSLAALLVRPLAGRLGDRRGRRPLMIAGAGVVGMSLLGYSLANSVTILIGLRLLTGAGEAMFVVGAATTAGDLAPAERRGEAMSLYSVALWAGLGAGPLLGEWVLHAFGFPAVWMVAGLLALLAAIQAGRRLPETRPALGPTVRKPPIVHPAGLKPGLVLLTSLWGLAGFTAFVPLHALDLGLGGSGWVFGLYAAIVLIVRSAGARLPDRVGPQRTVRLALVGSVVGLALIATLQSLPGLVLGTAAFAVGQALAFPALMTMAMAAAPAGERACVVGTLTASVDLAFGLGASSLALVAAVAGHEAVFLTGAFIAGIGLVIARRRNNFPTRRLATLSTNPTPAR